MTHARRSSVCFAVFVAVALVARPTGATSTGLSLVQEHIDNLNNLNTIQGPVGLAVSPAPGAQVYVTARGDNALNVFDRNLTTGLLTFVEAERQGIGGVDGLVVPETVTVSPDGVHVYVGTHTSVVVFDRDTGTGQVTFVEAVETLRGSTALAVSADGAYVYSTATAQGPSLTTYARDGGTGQLTFVQELEDGVGGVDGIARASSLVLSPDDAHVYVTSPFEHTVTAFVRNVSTGELTFLAAYQDDVGGVSGIHGAEAVAVSPNGAQVYVGSRDTGIAVFSRNAGTGLLTFVEAEQPNVPFRFGSIAVTADGAYVIGGGSDVVMALARDAGTGTLTMAGGDGFATTKGIVISPDSQFVYAGTQLDRVGTFPFVTFGCTATPQVGCPQPIQSQKALLYVKDNSEDKSDKFTWKWTKGAPVALGDFGDPVTGQDGAVLCIYDSSIAPQPVFEAFAPPGGICAGKPCWKFSGTSSIKYKDKLLLPNGMNGISLKAGIAGSSSIKVKGKGVPVVLPTLPLTVPVTAQLQSMNGNCWEAVFSTPILTSAEIFKAKGD